jgi:predicted metalloendopeptidase
MNQSGNNSPFVIRGYGRPKDPSQYMLYAWQGGLGLQTENYFLETVNQKIRKKICDL